MVNVKDITIAITGLLQRSLPSFKVERNPVRPTDPWQASAREAWVGVYRDTESYQGQWMGPQPWLCQVTLKLEIQVASIQSPEDCEDRLLDAEKSVLDVINADRTLGGFVNMVNGYDVAYEYNMGKQAFYQAAIVTIKAEVRTA
jgi:hypothetical protein